MHNIKKLLALSIISTAIPAISHANIVYQQGELPDNLTLNEVYLSPTEVESSDIPLNITEEPEKTLKTLPLQIIREKRGNKSKSLEGSVMNRTATTQSSSPSCSGFNLGTGIYGKLDYAGQEKCYFTNVSQPTKLESLLINQPSGVNYDLYLLKYDSTGAHTTLDISNNTNNTNEYAYAVVQPGTYLLIVKGVSGFNSTQNFIVGALGHNDYDEFEANDRANIATPLTGNTISSGNLDNNGDYDYFAYTFEASQTDSRLSFTGEAFHQLELFAGSGWVELPRDGQNINLNGSPGNSAYLRVRATPNTTSNAASNYTVRLANPSKQIINANIWSNENLTNLATANMVEAHNSINLKGTVVDSLGRKLEGDDVVVRVFHENGVERADIPSNSQGYFLVNFTLPDCAGDYNVKKWSYGTPRIYWDVSYDIYKYDIAIINSLVDGTEPYFHINNDYAHICSEKYVCDEFNMKDKFNGDCYCDDFDKQDQRNWSCYEQN